MVSNRRDTPFTDLSWAVLSAAYDDLPPADFVLHISAYTIHGNKRSKKNGGKNVLVKDATYQETQFATVNLKDVYNHDAKSAIRFFHKGWHETWCYMAGVDPVEVYNKAMEKLGWM